MGLEPAPKGPETPGVPKVEKETVPFSTPNSPVKVLRPVRLSSPLPFWKTLPVPEITPA